MVQEIVENQKSVIFEPKFNVLTSKISSPKRQWLTHTSEWKPEPRKMSHNTRAINNAELASCFIGPIIN